MIYMIYMVDLTSCGYGVYGAAILTGLFTGIGTATGMFIYEKYIKPKYEKVHNIINDNNLAEKIKNIKINTDPNKILGLSSNEEAFPGVPNPFKEDKK